jgi:hypothetical protein
MSKVLAEAQVVAKSLLTFGYLGARACVVRRCLTCPSAAEQKKNQKDIDLHESLD